MIFKRTRTSPFCHYKLIISPKRLKHDCWKFELLKYLSKVWRDTRWWNFETDRIKSEKNLICTSMNIHVQSFTPLYSDDLVHGCTSDLHIWWFVHLICTSLYIQVHLMYIHAKSTQRWWIRLCIVHASPTQTHLWQSRNKFPECSVHRQVWHFDVPVSSFQTFFLFTSSHVHFA